MSEWGAHLKRSTMASDYYDDDDDGGGDSGKVKPTFDCCLGHLHIPFQERMRVSLDPFYEMQICRVSWDWGTFLSAPLYLSQWVLVVQYPLLIRLGVCFSILLATIRLCRKGCPAITRVRVP